MRTFTSILGGLVLVSSAVVGCNSSSSGGTDTQDPVGTGEAKIVVASQSSASSTVEITATDTASGDVAATQTITISGDKPGVLDLSLDASSYKLHIDTYADAAKTQLVASGNATADLIAGQTTEIHLVASGQGQNGSTGSITATVDVAPQINSVDVKNEADGSISINVSASDHENGSLTYFWSGFGVDGAVQGSSTLTLSASALASALASVNASGSGSASGSVNDTQNLTIVVQDSGGASTQATIKLDLSLSLSGSGSVSGQGSSTGSLDTSGSASASVQACLDAELSCAASCDLALLANPLDLDAHASCTAACGLTLASCQSAQ